jgi:uncharacterized membrane protein YidH (DUF202 family)
MPPGTWPIEYGITATREAAKKSGIFPSLNAGKVQMKALGIVLIVLGVLALAYGGFTYTHQKKVIDLGPIQASKKETNTIPLPPILGVVAVLGGGVLLFTGKK